MESVIKHKKLSAKERKKCIEMITTAVTLLKKWSAYFGPRKGKKFRSLLLKGEIPGATEKNPCGCIPPEKFSQFQRELPLILAVGKTSYPCLGGVTVEYRMIQGYIKMVYDWATKFALMNSVGLQVEDYAQDGLMALQDAIWSYHPSRGANFSTYAWSCISRRDKRSTNDNQRTSPYSTEDLKLFSEYKKAVNEQWIHGDRDRRETLSFDDIANKLGLEEGQCHSLKCMLTQTFCESQTGPHVEKENGGRWSLKDAPSSEVSVIDKLGASETGDVIHEAIKLANLSDFEEAVLYASLNDVYGWQTKVAAEHLNPVTGKPYTKAGAGVVFRNAKEKLRKQLELMGFSSADKSEKHVA